MTLRNRNVPRLFDIRAPFRAKGLRLTLENRNFTSVFNIQPSFCANGLHLAVKTTKLYLELHIYASFVICAFAILHRILLTFMSCDISVGLHLNCQNCKFTSIFDVSACFCSHFVRKGDVRDHGQKIRISPYVCAPDAHDQELQGAAVRVVRALWSWPAAAGCCCQRALWSLGAGALPELLWNLDAGAVAGGRCEMSMVARGGGWRLCYIMFTPLAAQKKHLLCGVYAGVVCIIVSTFIPCLTFSNL